MAILLLGKALFLVVLAPLEARMVDLDLAVLVIVEMLMLSVTMDLRAEARE
jgi:hypothetical protein